MSDKKIGTFPESRPTAKEGSCAELRGLAGTDLRGSAFKGIKIEIKQPKWTWKKTINPATSRS